jgi:hypothetical protein
MPTTVWPWHKKRYTCSAFPIFEQAQVIQTAPLSGFAPALNALGGLSEVLGE